MPKKKAEFDFGKGFQELEEIAQWFERGEPDLDKGIAKFERATELAKALKDRLTEAENKIKEIRLKYES
jgi:exodeoxyribonuclease VII small subunit